MFGNDTRVQLDPPVTRMIRVMTHIDRTLTERIKLGDVLCSTTSVEMQDDNNKLACIQSRWMIYSSVSRALHLP